MAVVDLTYQGSEPRITEVGKLVYSEISDTLFIRTSRSGTKPIGGPETDPIFTAWLATPPNISTFVNDVGYLTTVAVDGVTITGDGTIGNPLVAAGTGDMLKAIYDPTNIGADAFDYNNFFNVPTNISTFTNDSGYITSSALTPYLLKAGGTMTGAFTEAVVALVDAANISVDATFGNIFTVTLGGNRILSNPTGAVNGQRLTFRVRQDGVGGRTLAFDTKFRFGSDLTSITLSTGINKTDYIGVIYHGADDKFDVVAFMKGY